MSEALENLVDKIVTWNEDCLDEYIKYRKRLQSDPPLQLDRFLVWTRRDTRQEGERFLVVYHEGNIVAELEITIEDKVLATLRIEAIPGRCERNIYGRLVDLGVSEAAGHCVRMEIAAEASQKSKIEAIRHAGFIYRSQTSIFMTSALPEILSDQPGAASREGTLTSSGEFTIRKLKRPIEIDAFTAAHNEAFANVPNYLPIGKSEMAHFLSDEAMAGQKILIAETPDGNIAGWIWIAVERGALTVLFIESIGILSQYRRRGIAARLVMIARSYAKEVGATRIEASVEDRNLQSLSLFRSQAFEVSSETLWFERNLP